VHALFPARNAQPPAPETGRPATDGRERGTDFEAHALWMDACVDLYCVAAAETKARLVARGAVAEDVVVTGIPISARFSAKLDAKAVRKSLGLRDDLPVCSCRAAASAWGRWARSSRSWIRWSARSKRWWLRGATKSCGVS